MQLIIFTQFSQVFKVLLCVLFPSRAPHAIRILVRDVLQDHLAIMAQHVTLRNLEPHRHHSPTWIAKAECPVETGCFSAHPMDETWPAFARRCSLFLSQGIGGRLDPPAYWPPICYGAFGGTIRLFEMFPLSLSPSVSLSRLFERSTELVPDFSEQTQAVAGHCFSNCSTSAGIG